MLDIAIEETAAVLNRRFLINAVLPVLLLAGALGAVLAADEGGVRRMIDSYARQSGGLKALIVVEIVVGVLFAAALLSSQTNHLLRAYEGYWSSPPARLVARVGRGWHRGRLTRLAERSRSDPRAYEQVYLRYPLPTQPEQVMPTRFGNALKNAETYPRDRYGIDAVLVWPRLFPLLPDRYVKGLANARADMEFLVVLSTAGGIFAAVTGTYLLLTGATWGLFLGCVWGGGAVAWTAYCGASAAAVGYAGQVKVAFDLYRRDLLQQVGVNAPSELGQERQCWQQLAGHWYRNVVGSAEDLRQEPPPPATKIAPLPLSGWLALGVLIVGILGALSLAPA